MTSSLSGVHWGLKGSIDMECLHGWLLIGAEATEGHFQAKDSVAVLEWWNLANALSLRDGFLIDPYMVYMSTPPHDCQSTSFSIEPTITPLHCQLGCVMFCTRLMSL